MSHHSCVGGSEAEIKECEACHPTDLKRTIEELAQPHACECPMLVEYGIACAKAALEAAARIPCKSVDCCVASRSVKALLASLEENQ